MNAIAIIPGTPGVRTVDRPEPPIAAPDDVKVRVVRVGICGTDREEAAGGRARAPEGQETLVLGHEMLGQVVEVGARVSAVRAGEYAVFTVRRGCGHCAACAAQRPDMCQTGDYRERGIWGLDGYQAAYVVDREAHVVRVPDALAPVGVLVEPLSVAEKAIDEAIRIALIRRPDPSVPPEALWEGRWLVAGLGPIGLLAAMILRLRGAEVFGVDIVDADSARPRWLTRIGGTYLDGRHTPLAAPLEALGSANYVVEATGVPSLAFRLIDALAPNGVMVLTGIPNGDRPLQLPASELVREMVLDNQVVVGSVNAARQHFQAAVDDLQLAIRRWGPHLEQLITHRSTPADIEQALGRPPADEIKTVIEWTAPGR
jgi:threonine dehydrogenase-like Zn-dependent dehydrogenase